ncbi:MAG: type IV pilus modification protein PilV [Pseudomonadota bacterium]
MSITCLPASHTRQQRTQGGYTLLEVLVAALLLTTGLIGLATMQVNGTRLNNSSYLRSQATILAYDIVDRMRANIVDARAGAYDIAVGAATPAAGADVPSIDLFQWRTAIEYNLPGGTAGVVRLPGAAPDVPSRFQITVRWVDDRNVGNTVDFTITTDI